MHYIEWLEAERGRSQALATHMERSKAAITLWREFGVPMRHMREVSAFTDGKVTVQELLDHALACSEKRQDKLQTEA